MSESAMWESLRPPMKTARLDPVRIESRETDTGIPDVNYTQGWIELKYLPAWPVRPETPVRVDHFTGDQRAWIVARTQCGGKVFVMLKVGRKDWLLFQGMIAARFLGTVPRSQLEGCALGRWTRTPKAEELRKCLLDQ